MNRRKPLPHPLQKRIARGLLFALLATAFVFFFAYDLHRFFTLSEIKAKEQALHAAYLFSPFQVIALYSIGAIAFVVCALPAASLLMLLAGAIFGPFMGTLICSIAMSAGAVLSLLSARFIFRDWIERKFARHARFVNRGVEKDGSVFLMTLRLLPMMPYFVTNLLLGLTKMSVSRFWIVSLASSLPAIALYAFAGSTLTAIQDLSDIWSPRLFVSLTLLALFPMFARACVRLLRANKVLKSA